MVRHSTDAVFQASDRRGERRSGDSGVAILLDAEVGAEAKGTASLQRCALSGIEPGAHSARVWDL